MFSIGSFHARERGRVRLWGSAPVIYGMIIPIAFLDVATRAYQSVCFRAYGIPKVDRRKYIRLTRRGRGVLRPLDQVNCLYCAYANGVLSFVTAVAGETEKYWCPIRHRAGKEFVPPAHHRGFAPDGDEVALQEVLQK
jgi:hypothetical protein